MKKLNPDIVRLHDILQAMDDIESYKLTTLSDKKDIHAVCYNIAIIGEAAGRISVEMQQKYSEIPWRQITGIRHKVIHDYSGVDVLILQDVITHELPSLRKQIAAILRCEQQ